jgi:putative NIF3 family GTP cyclohydrolase 1 type 2
MHKFRTNANSDQLWGRLLGLAGKLHENKSLKAIVGTIKSNLKNRDPIKIYQSQIKNTKRRVVQT